MVIISRPRACLFDRKIWSSVYFYHFFFFNNCSSQKFAHSPRLVSQDTRLNIIHPLRCDLLNQATSPRISFEMERGIEIIAFQDGRGSLEICIERERDGRWLAHCTFKCAFILIRTVFQNVLLLPLSLPLEKVDGRRGGVAEEREEKCPFSPGRRLFPHFAGHSGGTSCC